VPANGLEQALAATNTGITIADATRPGFPLIYANDAFEALTGYAEREILGRNCRFLQAPETDPAAIAEIAAALRDRRELRVVLRNRRKDGAPFYNELRLAPVFDQDGRYVQVIGVQNDVTDLVAADRSLRAERDHIRTSLDRAGRIIAAQDQELAELRVLQRALTPSDPPPRPHLDLASCFVAAEDGVAGDFYLVAPGPREATIVAVGDVIGHGLEAARRATFVRAALATFARFTDDPLRLLAMANHALIEHTGPTTEFVTAVCATYRPDERRLTWAAAGHPPPVALDTGEPVGSPDRIGVPLGIEIDLGAGAVEVPFAPEDGVLLFTDGLPEARPADRRPTATPPLGDERVRDLVRGLGGAAPRDVVRGLREAAAGHAGGRLADDLCIVAARATR
jgi:PAS domain S-box-containing protein